MTALQVARYPLIDVLKALAAQFIVLHHFSVYGPVSDSLHAAWPWVMGMLYEYGRIAVQVFFCGRRLPGCAGLVIIYR